MIELPVICSAETVRRIRAGDPVRIWIREAFACRQDEYVVRVRYAADGSDGSSANGSGGRPGGRSSRRDLAYAAALASRHRLRGVPRPGRAWRSLPIGWSLRFTTVASGGSTHVDR